MKSFVNSIKFRELADVCHLLGKIVLQDRDKFEIHADECVEKWTVNE